MKRWTRMIWGETLISATRKTALNKESCVENSKPRSEQWLKRKPISIGKSSTQMFFRSLLIALQIKARLRLEMLKCASSVRQSSTQWVYSLWRTATKFGSASSATLIIRWWLERKRSHKLRQLRISLKHPLKFRLLWSAETLPKISQSFSAWIFPAQCASASLWLANTS